MYPASTETIIWQVVGIGLGGSMLAAVSLYLEIRGHRGARVLAAAATTVLPILAVTGWLLRWPSGIWESAAGLAVISLLAWAGHFAAAQQNLARLLDPRVIWGGSLILFVSFAFALPYAANRPTPGEAWLQEADVDTLQVHQGGPYGETDAGRKIELFRYAPMNSANEMEELLLAEQALRHEIIRIAGPDGSSNCHGWVYTGGRFGVLSESVEMVLADNGYQPVSEPTEGDLVVFRNHLGKITHSAVVFHGGTNEMMLIVGKWGPLGVYIHRPESQPFGRDVTYYRSPRVGHHVKIIDAAQPQPKPASQPAAQGPAHH